MSQRKPDYNLTILQQNKDAATYLHPKVKIGRKFRMRKCFL